MSIENFINKASKTVSKSKQVTETDIEGDFVKFAKKSGCKAYKLIFLRARGFPDRTILCPGGRVFFIEFKRKGKKQTSTQISVQRALEGLGFEYYVCDEKGQAEKILEEFLAFTD